MIPSNLLTGNLLVEELFSRETILTQCILETIISSKKPLEEVFKLHNFLRPLIQVERKFEQYIFCLENDLRVLDSMWINGVH